VKPKGTRFEKKRRSAGKPAPSANRMDFLLQRFGIRLDGTQIEQLWSYHQLLRQSDAELNLTRIHNFENMVVKLYADSILPALQYPQLPSPLLDLGTGPGMPGIPLKIFRPDLHLLLAESRKNRTDFLKTAVAQLSIAGLEVVERGIAPDFERPVAGIITRAVEPMADTLTRVAGCLQQGGFVFFMKGPRCDAEIEAAVPAFANDYELIADMAYQIPRTPHRRRLVVFRRRVAPVQARAAAPSAGKHPTRVIESESNAIFKELKKLHGGRGVKKQGQTLVCGSRLTGEIFERSPRRCRAWISIGDRIPPPEQAPEHMKWLQLAPELFQTLDLFGTRKPLLLCDIPVLDVWNPGEKAMDGCSLLVPFQDPENVGATIRTACALNVDRIILLAESANPFHPKAVRASAGTVFSARLFAGPFLSDLPADLPVVALAASGRPLAQTRFPASFYLLPGMEGPGLPAKWQTDAVAIPMAPGVESLNAAVATAIALYEWRRNPG